MGPRISQDDSENNTGNIRVRYVMRVLSTIVAVEIQRVLYSLSVCKSICSRRYPARNAHAQYYHLWSGRLNRVFPHYLINGKIFGKKVTEHKIRVTSFSIVYD